jgi:predicted transposase YbfD/YdcC
MYYISSKQLDAKTLLNATRSHWLVELMHFMLDIEFGEYDCGKRAEDSAESFVRIRQMCLNLLRNEMAFKANLKHKIAKCAMEPEYLYQVLTALVGRECS